ncbi:DUF6456 domain-containing protein [Pseudooceanicola nanhaiensis]|uniref:DUF6456 domain-containing protein n=1 Tax=Pseudooceanicola nanhaiensis TaxID=375761 RepID=UPI001CD71396|nr:DUF6456 domain-containing protein [Pseudooceanicola nanhaiensis]MCA0921580.1 DUF6456 domain-containing protein [Pseudooceanicola nanhaiensis]
MSGNRIQPAEGGRLPAWVPVSAKRYIAHTEEGQSIRSLARSGGCHASTVLRQIRRIETQRDDLLVDGALRCLGLVRATTRGPAEESKAMTSLPNLPEAETPDDETLMREGRRVLRRLCEQGAVLAVAQDMEKAVVVRDQPDGGTLRRAVVERGLAQALALKDWIACEVPGRISRYKITSAGRAALRDMIDGPRGASGFSEAQQGFDGASVGDVCTRWLRFAGIDSPVSALARRRDRDGEPFLSADLVRAGERLREDFELAQMEPRTTQNWDRFLTAGTSGGLPDLDGLRGAEAARARVIGALRELGPGLGDVALRCCCHLEGLESAEKRMGWSARSGKIVLRIALQRLKAHYEALGDKAGLIG